MGSLEQSLANVVESANQLTQTVNAKMGQIDEKVQQASASFEQFKAGADDRYQTRTGTSVFVPGDTDKFYPVFIPGIHNGVAKLEIARQVHQDRLWAGALTASFLFQNGAWGGFPSILVLDVLRTLASAPSSPPDVVADGFIAEYSNAGAYIYGAIFWLRGGHTYAITSSLTNFKGPIYHDNLVSEAVFDHHTLMVFRSGFNITSGGVNTYADIRTARNLATIPELNYVRGV